MLKTLAPPRRIAKPAQRTPQLAPPPATSTARLAPSYDCRTARSATEIAICSDPTLAALDRELSSLYRRISERSDDWSRTALRSDQQRWLRVRDHCAGTTPCLLARYRARIWRLQGWL